MYYNVRVKTFPDGTKQYMHSEIAKEKGYELEERKKTGETVDRKRRENLARTKSKVFDLARSNKFDWFITLTFSDKKIANRYDYDSCADALYSFTHFLSKRGFRWIIVPEQHEDGAYHFHGLVAGDLRVKEAINPYTGKPLLDKHGRQVYNLNDYEWGFTQAVRLDNSPKVASYITKYYTKDMQIPKGRKRYWASRSLNKPMEEYVEMSMDEFGPIFNEARYQKVIESPYGTYLLAET